MKVITTVILDLDEVEADLVPREAQRLPRDYSRAVLQAILRVAYPEMAKRSPMGAKL